MSLHVEVMEVRKMKNSPPLFEGEKVHKESFDHSYKPNILVHMEPSYLPIS